MNRRGMLAIGAAVVALATGGAWTLSSRSAGAGAVRVVDTPAAELVTGPGRLVVDIREPDEWKETGVLPGALLHSYRDPTAFRAQFEAEIARGDEIFLVCRSGNRSNRAARQLARALGRPIHDVAGGMRRLTGETRVALAAPTARAGCPVC